ncbi:hypothetical protein [Deinococcus sp. Arct2-2]|uniref:hypothetical protein n=1 Tax=Deinococcus sp. Arct2-2 TaxID=2568653 RepID=UPI001F0F75EC|nr:hypothetical protein [Deinococcus sp. Arct2-2]
MPDEGRGWPELQATPAASVDHVWNAFSGDSGAPQPAPCGALALHAQQIDGQSTSGQPYALMPLTPGLRKFSLTVHVSASMGWLGAVAAFLALAVTGVTSADVQTVRAISIALEPLTRWVIVPLALASLLSGVVQAHGRVA